MVRLADAGSNRIPRREAPVSLRAALARSEALPPKLSARGVPSLMQLFGLVVLASGVAAAFWAWPQASWFVTEFLFLTLFFLVVLWRFSLSVVGFSERTKRSAQAVEGAGDEALPVYSILIALRDEAAMMPQLARSLSALDWPVECLDIILLIEADDEETRDAALAAPFPDGTRVLTVPPGAPLTKPRALNFGLAEAEGDLVAVYDAEDRPHPRQLREAYEMFVTASPNVLCVQAPLVATNGASSWVAAHWALEYAVQFGLQVPALSRFGHPIMLGGTSNHFRRQVLIAFGGWDAWNVTEDADLGLRAARLGGYTRTIRAPTLETAPERFGIWRAQRSRWIKGYMQTWLVCMRMPASLIRELGFVRWLSLQLTLGGAILSAFLYGPMTLIVAAGLCTSMVVVDLASFTLFSLGWVGGATAELLAPGRWSVSRLLAVATRPLYWPLQTWAALVAVYGLLIRPAFWAKTPHQPDESDPDLAWPPGSSPSRS